MHRCRDILLGLVLGTAATVGVGWLSGITLSGGGGAVPAFAPQANRGIDVGDDATFDDLIAAADLCLASKPKIERQLVAFLATATDIEARRDAVIRLGKMHSVAAVPYLVRDITTLPPKPIENASSSEGLHLDILPCVSALIAIGSDAMPAVVAAYVVEPPGIRQDCLWTALGKAARGRVKVYVRGLLAGDDLAHELNIPGLEVEKATARLRELLEDLDK